MAKIESDSRSGFFGIRPWVWIVTLASVVAVMALVWTLPREPVPAVTDVPALETPGSDPPIEDHEPLFPSDPAEETEPRKKAPPSGNEMPYAIPTFIDPLTVTLAAHPELGPISVERYNSEGNPAGEPLAQGTRVQIPNPNRPGEKIYFKVP